MLLLHTSMFLSKGNYREAGIKRHWFQDRPSARMASDNQQKEGLTVIHFGCRANSAKPKLIYVSK